MSDVKRRMIRSCVASIILALVISACAIEGASSGSTGQIARLTPTATPSVATAASGQLVFVRYNVALQDDEVFIIGADGTGERRLLAGAHQCPRWSPDGKWISMSGAMAPAFVGPEGAGLRELTSPDGHLILGCGTWSADGSRYFSEAWDDSDPSRSGIYSFDVADGGNLRRVTTPPEEGWDGVLDVSPDGEWLAFTRAGALYVVGADGGEPRLLADGFESGAWSPDGRTILTDADGSLYLITMDNGSVRELASESPNFADAYGARWSPDGTHVAFSMVSPGPYADIYAMRLDGTELRRLTHSPEESNELGAWSVAPTGAS